MIGDIISHIMVKQHSLGWQMTVAGNFKETDFYATRNSISGLFKGTFKTKQLPNCDFQHWQIFQHKRLLIFESTPYTLLFDPTTTMTLTYICSVDTRNRPVWGGGGWAVWHRSVLSRKRFICRPDGADWRLTTQKKKAVISCGSIFWTSGWWWTCSTKHSCLQVWLQNWAAVNWPLPEVNLGLSIGVMLYSIMMHYEE